MRLVWGLLGLVKVKARFFRVSLGKFRENKNFGFSIEKKTKNKFFLKSILCTNFGILITELFRFRLNRVRGIRIRNRIKKIPSSFCAIAI